MRIIDKFAITTVQIKLKHDKSSLHEWVKSNPVCKSHKKCHQSDEILFNINVKYEVLSLVLSCECICEREFFGDLFDEKTCDSLSQSGIIFLR